MADTPLTSANTFADWLALTNRLLDAVQTNLGALPTGLDSQMQFNDGGLFGAVANLTYNKVTSVLKVRGNVTSNTTLVLNNGGYVWEWRPTDYLNQNGSFGLRAGQTPNALGDRRDDSVAIGWNQTSEVSNVGSSALVFEAFYRPIDGFTNQAETYFSVGDGLGHSHRPWAFNYTVDADTVLHLFSGETFLGTNKSGNQVFAMTGGSAKFCGPNNYISMQGGATGVSPEYKVEGDDLSIDLVLRSKGNGAISLQTNSLTVSTPLAVDSGRKIISGSYSGNKTKVVTANGAFTLGHIAKFDSVGNLIDGGASGGGGVGGLDTYIQYNDNGSLAGSAAFRFDAGGIVILNRGGGNVTEIRLQDQAVDALVLRTTAGGYLSSSIDFGAGAGEAGNLPPDTSLQRTVNGGELQVNNGTLGQFRDLKLRTLSLTGNVGFFGTAAIAQPLLATGAAHTVDDVITALQALGLVRQS